MSNLLAVEIVVTLFSYAASGCAPPCRAAVVIFSDTSYVDSEVQPRTSPWISCTNVNKIPKRDFGRRMVPHQNISIETNCRVHLSEVTLTG